VLSEIVTATEEVYVPLTGFSTGVAAGSWIVYVALATALVVYPGAAAIAVTVVVCVTEIGAVYWADEVVGVLPSVV
jgi:hypothetical protein